MAAHSVYIFIYDPWGLIVRSCQNFSHFLMIKVNTVIII